MPFIKAVLFLLPYPLDKAPSQRFRVEQFLPLLASHNITYTIAPFMDQNTWAALYEKSSILKKGFGILKGYVKRWYTVLFETNKFDAIFIHREAAPLGPPVFEWVLIKVFKKRVIYDFDDAIWLKNTSTVNKFADFFKANWKVGKICKWAEAVTAGNAYLCNFAKINGAKKVVYLPTVVDTEKNYVLQKEQENKKKLNIGWTGSHSTLKYLKIVEPALEKLRQEVDFNFLIIADKKPFLALKNVHFNKWKSSSEVNDLLQLDIGIMPLSKDEWCEGKCGFKLIQYMALGIPAVASAVGVNKLIIENYENGFLCATTNDWAKALKKLIDDKELRQKMGKKGRKKIIEEFSLESQKIKFLNLFN